VVTADFTSVARSVPPEVRIGTSSWSFPGWKDIVYDRTASAAVLAHDGLPAYARHPLLRAVGIDRTYYAPVARETFAGWAAVVPEDFRFVVKAHELCTAVRVPAHERHGARGGEANDRFLDVAHARDAVVAPAVDGLGHRLGAILFQFPPQDARLVGGAARFAERLHAFLSALTPGPLYAVEIRTRALLGPAYAAALRDVGACHCFTVHPTMPGLAAQARLADPALMPAVVARWMLGGGLGYEEARARYRPFDRIVDPDDATCDGLADLCRTAAALRRPAFVIINNKAEGSAPLSAFRLARRLAHG